uniref:Uncharacterized protein n=1 Tax=Vitis vinifera TaxID=29760 RepID=A5AND7_VITVI|nr:hypothetical protein VITISV_020388 [Vitis vinifera]
MAAGVDWYSDESDDESPLCKALASLRKYWEALDIINLTLRLAYNIMPIEKKEELRSLGAQIAYNITDPKHGFDYVKYIVQQHPHSLAAWNCYYKSCLKLIPFLLSYGGNHNVPHCYHLTKMTAFLRSERRAQNLTAN